MKLGDAAHLDVESIPTGSLSLDIALGIGGIPRGRITEIYGPEGSGKTTLCLHIIAETQRMGGTAAIVDVEHALDPAYAEVCGVDVDELYISQPDTGEEALEIAEALIRSGAVDALVVDSVAALVPRAEIEGEMGDSHPGLQARLMSQAMRKLSGAIKQSSVDSSSAISSGRRSESCSGIPRRRPGEWRPSSTPRCASTSGASAPSSSTDVLSGTVPASVSRRTRLPHRSSRPSST